jgi:transposase InsO family protein
MGQVLHGSAATTHAVRAAIQRSEASIAELSRTYGVNPKTSPSGRGVRAWMMRLWARRTTLDRPHQRKKPLRLPSARHTLLPLDDCLYALQATIPNLTRSSLHRLFQRHDISRLPEVEGSKPKKKFKAYPIGYFHIDIAEVWTEEGKLYMLVAVDRTSKFAFAELHERITRRDAGNFLRRLIDAVPYRIHTVLTDNGTHFTDPKGDGWTAAEVRQLIAEKAGFRCHGFVLACAENDIDHRLTKPNHPWTNGQVERMNRTIKDATVRRYHYQSHERLRQHLAMFLDAYNFAKCLKTLKGLTVYEFINEKVDIRT